MATAMSAETLENLQHSTELIPESQSYTINTSCKNPRTQIILNLCSSLNAIDQVSHPYKTTGKIIVLNILIFTFLYRRREDKKF
jgi:hypothetical protein